VQDLPPVGAAVLAATGMQEPGLTCEKLRLWTFGKDMAMGCYGVCRMWEPN
jgi:hypothetical protein